MIRVRNIKIPVDNDNYELVLKKVSKKLKIEENSIKNIKINKKSVDARDKNNVHFVYELYITLENEKQVLKRNKSNDISYIEEKFYNFKKTGTKKMKYRPIIIGSGPAGLFCAYTLAEQGFKPIIIERGEPIDDRIKTVNEFWENGTLKENSNVQFGEGGAGTFSDGKLNTLVKDKESRMKKVFEVFVKCGAPEEIMYVNNPHIGTDILRNVVINMRNKIIEMGGEFRYNTTLTDIIINDNKIEKIVLNSKELLPCETLVLAIGHSARDTFKMLYEKGLNMHSKPFAVGLRIIHDQELINKKQYGNFYKFLEPASYKLTYKTKEGRGVYSFCMCPGGYVVNSSSKKERLVINGMSNYKRDSKFSNSAIVVTVNQEDYGYDTFDGVKFQERLEKKAYEIGKGLIPSQKFMDFVNNDTSKDLSFIKNAIKGKYISCNINNLLPNYISSSIKEGINYFDKKIPGFKDGTLLAVESRTSSPIQFYRDDNYMSNIRGIYPCGEGAGYAGGITTSAMDGIKIFESIATIYSE